MATGNVGYGIVAGNQTVNVPNYSAFGTEISVQKTWENIWLRRFPLFAMIKDGKANWNKGSDINGTRMIIAAMMGDTSTTAAGVANSAELTGITPYGTSNFSQASYEIAHYRHSFYVKQSEQTKINNARGNFLQGKIDQLTGSFMNKIADDLVSNSADAEDHVLGLQYALGTTNTIGGISQSTDTDWAAQSVAGGTFTLDILDNGIDSVTPRGGMVNLILLAYSSTNNLFGKLRAAIAPNERLVNQEFKAKYGFTNIQYLEATCISDNRLTAGVICGLDCTKWYYRGDETPKQHHVQPYPGTDAMEHLYFMMVGVGTSNPACNFKSTGNS